MGGQLGNVAFVIWRESVEALLVIGILNAWLARQQVDGGRGRFFGRASPRAFCSPWSWARRWFCLAKRFLTAPNKLIRPPLC